jgi:hypothetical protein
MKIVDLTKPKLSVYINNEEADLLKLFDDENPKWLKRDFDDRQLLIANQLVNKNILKRIKEDGRIVFKRRTR